MSQRVIVTLMLMLTFSIVTIDQCSAGQISTGALSGDLFYKNSGKGFAAASLTLDKSGNVIYTDIDGRFGLSQIPAGSHRLWIEASGILPKTSVEFMIKPGIESLLKIAVTFRGTIETAVTESALPDGNITGSVISSLTGSPVPDAEIRVLGIDRATTTDSSGRFSINNIAAGMYSMTASMVGCAVTVVNDIIVSGGDTRTIDIVGGLKPGRVSSSGTQYNGTIVGTVVDRLNDMPLVGGSVSLVEIQKETVTDPAGRFRFNAVPQGCYSLCIVATGYKSSEFTGIPSLDSQVTNITIHQDPTGTSQKDLTINPWRPGALNVTVKEMGASSLRAQLLGRLLSTGQQSFADSVGCIFFADVLPGKHDVVISSDGFLPDTLRGISISEGDTTRVEAHLIDEKRSALLSERLLKGRIYDVVTNNSIENARISLTGKKRTTTSDSAGGFSIQVPASDDLRIIVVHPNYQTVLFLQDTSTPPSLEIAIGMTPGDTGRICFIQKDLGGTIAGTVTDLKTGKPIQGARIAPDGIEIAAISGIDGGFIMSQVPAGKHGLKVFAEGFEEVTNNLIVVRAGESSVVRFPLKKESVTDLFRLTVSGTASKNTTAGLLKERQQSLSLADAIGGIEMSRAGASNAADAMKRVTGTTITDGKYVFVRGLGERYNITLLDGAPLPSPDPDKRSVPLDIFPTSLIENISTIKTFSPDLPGDFTGGCINISTKAIPEKKVLSFSATGGYNSETTFRKNFLSYQGGKTDWLGIDDGTRAIPQRLQDTSQHVPTKSDALWGINKHERALLLDTLTRLFTPVMSPESSQSYPNQSYALTYGNTCSLGSIPLGFLTSLSYSNKYAMFSNGTKVRFGENILDTAFIFSDNNKSTHEILWGALGRLSGVWYHGQQLQFDYMYVRHSTDDVFKREGKDPRDASAETMISSKLNFTEQGLSSFSVKSIDTLFQRAELACRFAAIRTRQNEPDSRTFTRSYIRDESDTTIKIWAINNTIYTAPTRYFRNLFESNNEFSVDLTIPFSLPFGDSSRVRTGGSYSKKERDFNERRFSYGQGFHWSEDPSQLLFSDSILGLKSTNPDILGNFIIDEYEKKNNYSGWRKLGSGYFLTSLQLPFSFRLIVGLRYEYFDMYSASLDTTQKDLKTKEPIWFGHITEKNILPSVNLIYTPIKSLKFFASYSLTVLRPSMREITPYVSYDFENEWNLYGTTDLKSSECTNFDLRCEWYPRPGEIISLGGYYKLFKNTIDLIENPIQNDLVTPENAPSAYARGIEFEARTKLDFITPVLSDFSIGFNVSFMDAKTKLSDVEIGQYGLEPHPEERPYLNQAPWVYNGNLSYDNQPMGLSSSIYFNLPGPMNEVITTGGTNVKLGIAQLDWTLSKKITKQISAKCAVFNILNSSDRTTYNFQTGSTDGNINNNRKGVSVSLGATYTL